MENRIKQLLGEQMFNIAFLHSQLEAAQARIKSLEKAAEEKAASEDKD